MTQIFRHESHDVDEQAKAFNNWQQSYEQLGRGRFRGSVTQLVMDQGTLLREACNRPIAQHAVPPKGYIVLLMPLAITPGSMYGRRPLVPESLLVLSDQDQHDMISSGELAVVALSIHHDMVAATLGPEEIEWFERAKRKRCLDLTPESASLLRRTLLTACSDAERGLDSFPDRASETALLSSALTRAVDVAMSGECSERALAFARRGDNRLRVINRAVEFMRANLFNEISIPQICAAAFASRRTLQYCFEEFMHTAPQSYLRALRLNEARRALKLRPDQPIADLAALLSFSSASHFTRHYKLMFEELPSETHKNTGHVLGQKQLNA